MEESYEKTRNENKRSRETSAKEKSRRRRERDTELMGQSQQKTRAPSPSKLKLRRNLLARLYKRGVERTTRIIGDEDDTGEQDTTLEDPFDVEEETRD